MWKQIKNFPNYYVNENGDVKSATRTITDSVGHVYELGERILRPRTAGKGYLSVCLRKNGKSTSYYIHRLVAETFLDNPNNLTVVNHKDGNKHNNNINNLEWVTYSDNNQHAYDTSLKPKGENFYNSKLTEENIKEIKAKGKYTTYKKIADKYGVSQATIRDILINRTWKNVS